MKVYKQGEQITGLAPAGYLKSVNATFFGPEAQDVWRIDAGSMDSVPIVGIWGVEKGKFELTYGTNEFVTILEGRAVITQGGKSYEVSPGDSFFTPKGETVQWHVLEDIRKCFMVTT